MLHERAHCQDACIAGRRRRPSLSSAIAVATRSRVVAADRLALLDVVRTRQQLPKRPNAYTVRPTSSTARLSPFSSELHAYECNFGSSVSTTDGRRHSPRVKCTVTVVTASMVTSTLNLPPATEVCSGDVSGGPPKMRMGRCVPGTFPEMAVNIGHK